MTEKLTFDIDDRKIDMSNNLNSPFILDFRLEFIPWLEWSFLK